MSNEPNRTELIKLVNETIDAMRHVPVIDASTVVKAAIKRMPQGEPQFIRLEADLMEIAAEILRKRFDPVARSEACPRL
jgi:hypothetical protein